MKVRDHPRTDDESPEGSRRLALLFLQTRVSVKCRYLSTVRPGKIRYRLYRGLVGPQGRPGRVRNIPPLPEFDPWTVQSVASRYTDQLIPLILFRACPITLSNERNNNAVTAVL